MSNPKGPINSVLSSFRKLIPAKEKVIICCSGGADSMALLFCAQLAKLNVMVAHCVHDMRNSSETQKDRILVENYCEKHGIDFRQVSVELKNSNVDEPSENSYRIVRYSKIEHIAEIHNIKYAITGHHADDQLETMIMKLCRGSGLRGLSGIAESTKSSSSQITYIRPMLQITKKDVYDICKQNKIPYNEDLTNLDTQYTRNALRHKILPVLMELFPACSEKINNTSRIIANAQELAFESLYNIRRYEKENINYDSENCPLADLSITIPTEILCFANDITVYEWLRGSFDRIATPCNPSFDSINNIMVEKVITAIREKSSKRFTWPNSVFVYVNKKEVKLVNHLTKPSETLKQK